MIRYRLSTTAEFDLSTIFWQGLERFGVTRTERYVQELEKTFAYLSQFPEATRLRTELRPAVRVYPMDAHVIVYEIEDDGVVVLRIRAARENWTANPLGDEP